MYEIIYLMSVLTTEQQMKILSRVYSRIIWKSTLTKHMHTNVNGNGKSQSASVLVSSEYSDVS
jgi:hypothetical protein